MTLNAETIADLRTRVPLLMRYAAESAILPRFGQLERTDINEKTPGELVTVADRDAEAILSDGLLTFVSKARVVGEEACDADPSLLDQMDEGLVWLVDPLDGTMNFAGGKGPFGIIVALAEHGDVAAAWLYDPLIDRTCFAARGMGAWMSFGGESAKRLRVRQPEARPIASLATQFMPAETRDAMLQAAAASFELRPIPRCAAEHYPRLCLCENHIALFQRTLPWDHAAGALLLTEAGGHVARWNGRPYMFHDNDRGILAATSVELWKRAADVLLNGGAMDGHALLPQSLDPGL